MSSTGVALLTVRKAAKGKKRKRKRKRKGKRKRQRTKKDTIEDLRSSN